MKTISAMTVALFLSLPVLANNGPYERYPHYSTSVNCSQIKTAIADAGALVIYRARHLYSLYAHHSGYCGSGYEGRFATLPTKDGSCSVLECRQSSRN